MSPKSEVVLGNVPGHDAVLALVRDKLATLYRSFPRIQQSRVWVQAPHGSRRSGNLFEVHIDLRLPRTTVAVSRSPSQHRQHENVQTTVRDAFRSLRRRLQHLAGSRRGFERTSLSEVERPDRESLSG